MPPIYDYVCEACACKFEEFYTSIGQAEREQPNLRCPACQSDKKKREIPTKTSFALKGSGWARDKYSGKKPQ